VLADRKSFLNFDNNVFHCVALSGIVNSMKELLDITVQIFLLFNLVAMDDSREEFILDDLVPNDFHALFLDEELHPYTREDL
jgi:hypothetical protein